MEQRRQSTDQDCPIVAGMIAVRVIMMSTTSLAPRAIISAMQFHTKQIGEHPAVQITGDEPHVMFGQTCIIDTLDS